MASRSSTEKRSTALVRRAMHGIVVLAALGFVRPALAGPREDADAALRRGVELRREGKDAEALEVFQQALSLVPSARARAQVALAEQALSLWTAAERDLALALAARDDPWIRQHREALEGAARVVASKLAWVTLDVNVRDPEVYVNGAPAPVGEGGRVRVVAGLVNIEVRAPGLEPASRSLRIAPESTTVVSLVLEKSAERMQPFGPSSAPLAGEPTASTQRTAGWILTGIGVVAVGGGTFYGLRAISKKDERDADCIDGCSQAGVDADRAGRTAGLVSTIAIVGGLAATAAGVWFVVSAPSAGRASSIGVRTTGTSVSVAGTF